MRVFIYSAFPIALLLGAAMAGCDSPPAASPAGGLEPSNSTNVTSDERVIQVDAPGVKVDIGGDANDDVDGGRRRKLRIPNVEVDVNRMPSGGVDVNVERRPDMIP